VKLIYVCPNCGADLECGELLSDPPVPVMKCNECGFIWYGQMDLEEVRVPFMPPVSYDWNVAIDYVPDCCRGCANHPRNGGSGICNCALPYFAGGGVTC